MMINRKIRYFVTLAECLSFTQTAAQYDVSQTAVSQYISSLEERLKVRLFERSQRQVTLTEAGAYYYARVKAMLRTYDETLNHLHTLAQGYRARLKVGVGMYEYCSTEGFISRFLSLHPEVRLDILQYPYSTLTEKLKMGEVDIIICDRLCEDAFPHNYLISRTLFSSPNYIVAHPDVAKKYGGDVRDMLRSECLITNCETDGPSSLQMLNILFMDEFGFVPGNISQTNSVNAQLMMVRACRGAAMVPGFILSVYGQGLVRFDLPDKRRIRYQLMYLRDCKNDAVPLLYHFEEELAPDPAG
ncbi:MAG: LysR family transcriptional regulator [Clostridia bacterium]|nr:LysR family transcriptional regulator [Clostridia bacterium]